MIAGGGSPFASPLRFPPLTLLPQRSLDRVFPCRTPQFLRCAVSHEPNTCGEFSGPENAGAMYTRAVELPALKIFLTVSR